MRVSSTAIIPSQPLPQLSLIRRLGVVLRKYTRLDVAPILLSPCNSIPAASGDIDAKPYDKTCERAHGKEERKPEPVVARVVDDGLDNIRPDHRRSAVG